MSRWGLTSRAICFCVLLVLGTSAILGGVYNLHAYRESVQTKIDDALIYARAASQNAEPALLINDIAALQRIAATTGEDQAVTYVTITGDTSDPIASWSPATSDNKPARPEILLPTSRISENWSSIERFRDSFRITVPIWLRTRDIDLEMPEAAESVASRGDAALGLISIDYTLNLLRQQIAARAISTGLIAIAVVAVASFATVLIVRHYLNPIHDLVSATAAVAEGDLGRRATENASGEIGLLARSFNQMAVRLQSSYETIERKVDQRTIELEKKALELIEEIAERQHAESQLREAKETAEAASRAKSEFLANMSHELRTPLNGVIGMTDLLMSSGLEPKQAHYARTVKTSADALLNLINDILDLSKVEAGKLELERLDFDLWDTVEGVTDIMAHKAAEKQLELTCFVDPAIPPHLNGDPARLQQVLVNLVSNAVKFTQGGEVGVRATLSEESDSELVVQFDVRDTGIGIPTERLDRLFKAFSQVDASTTRKYGGTGLGLRISKQLVELMGGQIGVESEPNRGSRFWFTVRLQKLSERSEMAKRHLSYDQLKSIRALIVDDNATNREILRQQLEGWGIQAETAEGGVVALKMLREANRSGNAYQLAILDMQMPEMDGAQLGEIIRADASLPVTPMIMLTSMTDNRSFDRIRTVGFNVTIAKPVKQSLLLDAILKVTLNLGRAKERNREPVAPGVCADLLPRSGARSVRILLVEDNEINQDVATNILDAAGYTSDIASNGREAVDAVQKGIYDLVLMDCQMPEMDGFEATRRIRKAESAETVARNGKPRIPIVALTANALAGDRDRCLEAGMDEYITKPLDPQSLLKVIDSLLSPSDPAAPQTIATRNAEGSDAVSADGTSRPFAFDLQTLADRCLGKLDLIEKIIGKFQMEADTLLDEIIAHVDAAETEKVARLAHTLKGMAANLSAIQLHVVACQLEQYAKREDVAAMRGTVPALKREFEQCIENAPQVLSRMRGDETPGYTSYRDAQ